MASCSYCTVLSGVTENFGVLSHPEAEILLDRLNMHDSSSKDLLEISVQFVMTQAMSSKEFSKV